MANRLRKLEITRVDTVDAGANPEADIVLFKRAQGGTAPSLKTTEVTVPEAIDKSKLDEPIQKHLTELETQVTTLTKERDDAKAEIDKVKKDHDDLTAEVEKLKKGAASDPDPDPEDVLKSLPAEVRKRLEDAETAAKDSADRIAKMERDNAERSAIAKAKSDYEHLGDAETLGKALVEIEAKVDAELVKSLHTVLKGANAKIGEGALFEEVGKNRSLSANENLDAKVSEVMKRDSISKAKATEVVMTENPELFELRPSA